MGRKPLSGTLDIRMNGRLVGELRKERNGAVEFRYADGWLSWDNAIPLSSSMPLSEERYGGPIPSAFFENLLPDEREIRLAVAAKIKATSTSSFDLLAAIGRDCIGALQFLPKGTDPGPVGEVMGREASEQEIASIIRGLAKAPLGAGVDPEFRISLAGAQEKTALLWHEGKWMIPQGTTATTHILKPTIGMRRDGLDLSLSVENELFCLRLVEAFGLRVPRAEIVVFEDQKVLSVTRFDRAWLQDGKLIRLPQEDLCQALGKPVSMKYEADGGPGIPAIMAHLGASDDPVGDRRCFLQAQILFWLIGATDGHAKNFSQFLRPSGRFSLTPFYDVISAQPNVDGSQITRNKFKLAMAIGRNRHYVVGRIGSRHYEETMTLCGMSEADAKFLVDELTVRAPQAIQDVMENLPSDFPGKLAESIVTGLRTRLGL